MQRFRTIPDAGARTNPAGFPPRIIPLPPCHLDRIRAAVDRADYERAAGHALDRLRMGLELPSDLIADILVGVESIEIFLVLARQATGESLLDLLRCGRLPGCSIGADQATYTTFALWQTQPPEVVRPVVVPVLRRLARRPELSARARGLIAWFVEQIGDPHLAAIYQAHHGAASGELADTAARLAMRAWSAPIDQVIAPPPRQGRDPRPGPVSAQIAYGAGRNATCPCGSGKKYKRCCAERPATLHLPRAERLGAIEPHLERAPIAELSRAELASLDLARLRGDVVAEVMERQAELRDWPRACLARDEIAHRYGKEVADELLRGVIQQAVSVRHYDAARQLLAQLYAPELAPALTFEVDLAMRGPDLEAKLEQAIAAVQKDAPFTPVDLACALLRTMPALGLLVAHGIMVEGGLHNHEALLDAIEEARDDLALPPDDPVRDLLAMLSRMREHQANAVAIEAEHAQLTRTAADLRASLDRATAQLVALQHQVAESQHAAGSSASEDRPRALRDKIYDLQAIIRERNEERNELRRLLASAAQQDAGPSAHMADDHTADGSAVALEDLDPLTEPPTEVHRVLLPRFGETATAAFEPAPRHVAASAVRTIGALAAGDLTAWRNVKQAKGMPRQVLLARIGIHHRLLFRASDGFLEVLDLVTRQNLHLGLKRLRAT